MGPYAGWAQPSALAMLAMAIPAMKNLDAFMISLLRKRPDSIDGRLSEYWTSELPLSVGGRLHLPSAFLSYRMIAYSDPRDQARTKRRF